MRSHLCVLAMVFSCLGVGPTVVSLSAADDGQGARLGLEDALPDSTWRTVLAIDHALQQNQLDPPAKQQVILAAGRAIYRVSGQSAPRGISAQVSQLSTDEELRVFLSGICERTKFPNQFRLSDANEQVGQYMLQQVAPASGFVSAKDHKVNEQIKDNQYVGIGIRVSWENDRAMIVEPFPRGPAHQAGARMGDYIIEIDETKTDDMDLGRVVDVLRGPLGTDVTVVVRNRDGSPPRILSMTRNVVPIDSVKSHQQRSDGHWDYWYEREAGVAYLLIDSLVGSTAAELQEVARQLQNEGVAGVILDLRQLRDADLHHALMVADVLLSEHEFATVRFAASPELTLRTRPDHLLGSTSIAVLPPPHASGPVFALLQVLARRDNTALVGSATTSQGVCYASFPLVDDLGAIAHVAYARLSAESQHAIAPGYKIEPEIAVSRADRVVEQALEWLAKAAR